MSGINTKILLNGAIVFACLIGSSGLMGQDALDKGQSAYDKGQYAEALVDFQDALLDDPENPILNYNVGAAQYQQEKYEEALASFQKAALTQDPGVQQSAYYNQGNALYRLQKYQEAVAAYKQALDLNPDDEDAKFNLELVRAKIKEMADKQQQENQQQQDQEQIVPTEYAKQLKAEAERLIAQRRYREGYDLLTQGMNTDPTVAAFQSFIDRSKEIVDIEEAKK